MMYNFQHWGSWKSITRRFATISTAGSVQQEWMNKEASNVEHRNIGPGGSLLSENLSQKIWTPEIYGPPKYTDPL